MTITETITAGNVDTPDRVARQVVLPEGHRDDAELFEAYRWLRENNPLAWVEVDGYDPVWLVGGRTRVRVVSFSPDGTQAASAE